jgi:hypothetical protein
MRTCVREHREASTPDSALQADWSSAVPDQKVPGGAAQLPQSWPYRVCVLLCRQGRATMAMQAVCWRGGDQAPPEGAEDPDHGGWGPMCDLRLRSGYREPPFSPRGSDSEELLDHLSARKVAGYVPRRSEEMRAGLRELPRRNRKRSNAQPAARHHLSVRRRRRLAADRP